MAETTYNQIIRNGLWRNNAGLVQLLGLCPLLAVSSTFVNGLGLGLATTLTLVVSNICVSAIRHFVRQEIRIPIFVLIIASTVTAIELLMNAYFHQLYIILGIFIPLIVTNCAIIGRAEAFAFKHSILKSAIDGLMMGLGFLLVLVTLGALREIIGFGTLFDQLDLMFGPVAAGFKLALPQQYEGLLLAVLPPGAFLGLALLIALKNSIEQRQSLAIAQNKLDEKLVSQT